MTRFKFLPLLVILSLWGANAFSQEKEGGGGVDPKFASSSFEAGVVCGQLLPNQIPGLEEMMALCGGRLGMKLGQNTRMEPMLLMGAGRGQKYVNGALSFRGDSQVEDFIFSFYGGPDIHYITVPDPAAYAESTSTQFGLHVGGALWWELTQNMYFRFDMKFNLNPGTALFVGFGLVLRMSGGGGDSGGE